MWFGSANRAYSAIAAGVNPIGGNLYTGGTTGLEGSALPMFQNAVTSGRGFTTGYNTTYSTLNPATGYPDGSQSTVAVILYTANVNVATGLQNWFWNGTAYRTFKCGWNNGNGSETITGLGCTVTKTSGSSTNVTWDLTPDGSNSAIAFTISGVTQEPTLVYAYLPDYPLGLGQFTNEYVSHVAQFAHIRPMFLKDAWDNNQPMTSATRNTPANTKARKDWFPGPGNPGYDGYPSATLMALANQAGVGYWDHVPAIDDGTFQAAMAADAALIRVVGLKDYYEFCNELWNGTGAAGLAMLAQAAANGFTAATFNGTIVGNALTINSLSTGTVAIGDSIFGVGISTGTTIQSGAGTSWVLNHTFGTVGPEAMSTSNDILMYEYVGSRIHNLSGVLASAYGAARRAADVRIVAATQQGGNGKNFMYHMLSYMTGQGWTPSVDIYMLAVAPYLNTSGSPSNSSNPIGTYWRSTFTASVSSGSNAMTTSGASGTITIGDLVFSPSLPVGTTIASGSGTSWVLSANATANISGKLLGSNPTTHTVAQILANLAGTDGSGNKFAVNTVVSNCVGETLVTLAKWYGMAGGCGTYEMGWQVNNEIYDPNIGAALMDPGFRPVLGGLIAACLDSGMGPVLTKFEIGAAGIATLTGFGPTDSLDYNAATLVAGTTPSILAIKDYATGTYVPQKNQVFVGSQFSCLNYADYQGSTPPTFAQFGLAPPLYAFNGYLPYVINSQVAQTRTLKVWFTNTSASAGSTNVTLNGVVIATAISIPGSGTNGGVNQVNLGSVTVPAGSSSLILGTGSAQGTISITDSGAGPAPYAFQWS